MKQIGTSRPSAGDVASPSALRAIVEAGLSAAQARAAWLALAAVLALTFVAYSPALSYWFMGDDFWFLRASQTAASPLVYLREAFDYRTPGPPDGFSFYRPLYQSSFPVFYVFFRLEAWPYHLLMIAFHLVNTLLVWLIARKVTGRDLVAHLAALIFGLHPAYASAVAWVTASNSVYATMYYLTSLWLFLKCLDGGPRRHWYYAGSLLMYLAAILTHPETLVLTALIAGAYVFVYARSLDDLGQPWPWVRLAPFLAAGFALFQIQMWVRDHSVEQTIAFSIGTHMFENSVRLAGMVLYPAHIIAPRTHLEQQATSAVALGVIVVAVVLAGRGRLLPKLFLIGWFVMGLMPISTGFAVEGRKLYSAVPPIAILLAMFGVLLWDRRPRIQGYLPHAAAVALVMLASLGMMYRGHQNRESVDVLTAQSKAIITQVRETGQEVEPDTHIYLLRVPIRLLIFGDSYVRDALRMYYGDIEVTAGLSPEEWEAIQPQIDDNDIVLFYENPLARR